MEIYKTYLPSTKIPSNTFIQHLVPPITSGMLDAQGMVFLIAGYETTANTLQSAVYLLAKNPDVQNQLYEEVVNICESSSKINHETITVRK